MTRKTPRYVAGSNSDLTMQMIVKLSIACDLDGAEESSQFNFLDSLIVWKSAGSRTVGRGSMSSEISASTTLDIDIKQVQHFLLLSVEGGGIEARILFCLVGC